MPQLSFSGPRSLHVGLPVEELDNALAHLQQVHDVNKQQADQLDVLAANLPVIQGDQERKDAAVEEIRNHLGNIAKSGDYEHMGSRITSLAKQFATNRELNAMSKNYAAKAKEDDTIAQMRSQGMNPYVFHDNSNFETVGKDGNINYLRSDVQQPLDADKKLTEIWSVILPDAVNQGLITAEEANDIKSGRASGITRQIGDVSIKGISPEKIESLRQFANSRFAGTNEGRQLYRVLNELDPRFANMSQEDKSDMVQAEISNRVADIGFMKTFQIQDINWKDDTVEAQTRILERKTKADEEKKRAELLATNIVGLAGAAINNPRGLTKSYGDDVVQAKALDQSISTNRQSIKLKEEYLANNPNLSPTEKIEKEQELKSVKIETDFLDKQRSEIEKRATQDYVQFLANPVDVYGNPIEKKVNTIGGHGVTESSQKIDKKIDPDQASYLNNITIRMDEDQVRAYTPDSKQLLSIVEQDPQLTKMRDWIAFDMASARMSQQLQTENPDAAARNLKTATEDANNIIHNIYRHAATQEGGDYMADMKTYVDNIGVDYLQKNGYKVTPDETKKIEYNVYNTLSNLKKVDDAVNQINSEENQSDYYELTASSNYTPAVYDFSVNTTNKGDTSDATKELSKVATNQWTSFAFIENGVLTDPKAVSDVQVTGITDYVPGQGYMLVGTYKTANDVDDKGKPTGALHPVYLKPKTSDGIMDSQINKVVQNTLVNKYATYNGDSNTETRAIALANAIQSDFVDRQFDRFRSVPQFRGQTIDNKVILDSEHQYLTKRINDVNGTRYELSRLDGKPFENGKGNIVYNDLETMVSNLEGLNSTVNYVPVDTSAASRSNNLFHISESPDQSGMIYGQKVTGNIQVKDANGNGQTLHSFASPEDGWNAGVQKIQNIYDGKSKAFSPNMTIEEFRKVYVYGNKEAQGDTTLFTSVLKEFYPDKTDEEIKSMSLSNVPIRFVVAATLKSEVSNKVFENVVKPLYEKYYGQRL